MTDRELRVVVRRILSEQPFGVLATSGPSGPHTTIVSFATADDLSTIVFATPRDSRKFANLSKGGDVSFFVDNRSMDEARLLEIHGVEARGRAQEVTGSKRDRYEEVYLARHPSLEPFAAAAAMVLLRVEQFDVVHRFQNVLVFRPEARP